jgi:drug/metabolite transporter (DMT)-like permease
MSSRTEELRGLSLAVGSGIAFGTLAIFAKLAYDEGIGPLALLASRFSIASVLIAAYCWATGRQLWPGARRAAVLLLLGGFGYGFEAAMYFIALEHAPAGIVGLIFYSYPMWTIIIGIATGMESFSGRVLIALGLGTLGVASVFSVSETGLLGPLLALSAALVVAVYMLLSQLVLRAENPSATALWTSVGAAVSVGVAAAISETELPLDAVPHAGALGLASAVAFLLLYAAIKRVGSARSAVANMVEPITTVGLAALVLDEELTLRIAIGAALVVSALPVLASAQSRKVVAPSDTS